MQLEVSKKLQDSQLQEIETMKDVVSKAEEISHKLKNQDGENQRKEISMASEVMQHWIIVVKLIILTWKLN